MVVVTVATDERVELSSLKATVAAAGLELVVLGLGREYGSRGGTKLGQEQKNTPLFYILVRLKICV